MVRAQLGKNNKNAKMPPTDRVYTHMEQIGAGMYGQVYMAHNRQTDSLSAIKKIPKDSGTGIPSNALREIALLREYAHPNIVQLQDVVCLRHELHLVFEHIEQDLRCFLDSRARYHHHNQQTAFSVHNFDSVRLLCQWYSRTHSEKLSESVTACCGALPLE